MSAMPTHPEVARGFEDASRPYSGSLDWRVYPYLVAAFLDCTFTIIGMIWLFLLRKKTAIRMRNIWLLLPAITLVHTYTTLVLVVYAIRWWYGCVAEYVVMGFILQGGVSLVAASNARLRYYYEAQVDLLRSQLSNERSYRPSKRSRFSAIWKWFKDMDLMHQTFYAQGAMLVATLVVVLIVLLGSYNFHKSYGFFGKWTGPSNCLRGTDGEWVFTALVLAVWTYIHGPLTLTRVWFIKDTHGWALQTKINIMANLPGIPVWLFFLYSNNPTVLEINRYFPHAGWLFPGLFVTKWCSIIFPLLDMYHRRPYDELSTLSNRRDTEQCSWTSYCARKSFRRDRGRYMYTINALDEALEKNVEPLLIWSAQRDFSAENIAFLRAVRDLKNKWAHIIAQGLMDNSKIRARYEEAAVIFFKFIDTKTSLTPLNLDKYTVDGLREWFRYVSWDSSGDGPSGNVSNVVAPFNDFDPTDAHNNYIALIESLYRKPATQIKPYDAEDARASEMVPDGFSLEIFDQVYMHIRQLVYTNSWPRYIDSRESMSNSVASSLQSIASNKLDESLTKETSDNMPRFPMTTYHPASH